MKGMTWSIAASTCIGVFAWWMALLRTRTSMSASNRGRVPNAAFTMLPLGSSMLA